MLDKKDVTSPLHTACANCYSVQPCIDDGEAYICADRAACQARVATDQALRAALAWLRREAK